jgi:hypothetical protein
LGGDTQIFGWNGVQLVQQGSVGLTLTGGNVGIGTIAPGDPLDIELNADDSSARLGVFRMGNIYNGPGDTNNYTFSMGLSPFTPLFYKSLSLSGGSSGSNLAFLDNAGAAAAYISFGSSTGYGHNITVEALASQTPDIFDVLSSSGGRLLNVQPNGNVGVGAR